MRNIINDINYRNVNKQDPTFNFMVKKGVGITLDEDIHEVIKDIQNNSMGSKFSTLVNCLLRSHPEVKKRLKK